jgi:hypothetical protein
VGTWPSRWDNTYGELNAFSSLSCWSSVIPISSANGLVESSSLASASIGNDIVMAPILPRRPAQGEKCGPDFFAEPPGRRRTGGLLHPRCKH